MHVGLEATADIPLATLRRQLEVNLIAQVSVTQVRRGGIGQAMPFSQALVLVQTCLFWACKRAQEHPQSSSMA